MYLLLLLLLLVFFPLLLRISQGTVDMKKLDCVGVGEPMDVEARIVNPSLMPLYIDDLQVRIHGFIMGDTTLQTFPWCLGTPCSLYVVV